MKMDFETIKQVMSEQYSQTEMEVLSVGGNVEGVAKMLKEKGLNPDSAGTVVTLIKAGMSEEEALNQVKQ